MRWFAIQPPTNSNSEVKHFTHVRYDKLEKLRQYLKSSKNEKTISQIAEDLNLSRNTVKIYLKILQMEGDITYREVGPAKLWFSRKTKEKNSESRIPDFVHAILLQLMTIFEKHNDFPPEKQNGFFQEVGKEIGKKVAWPGEGEFRNSLNNITPRMKEIKVVVGRFLAIIEETGIFLKAEMVPIVTPESEAPILIRATFNKEDWGQFKQYFNLMAGYFEAKLQMIFGESVYLKTHEIEPAGQWCYYLLGIKDKNNENATSTLNLEII